MIEYIDARFDRPSIYGDATKLHVADGAALADVFVNLNGGEVFIEEHVMFGHRVMLITGAHDYRKEGRERMESGAHCEDWPWKKGRNIYIRRGAWICSGAIIVGPVVIGEHAVVSAGAVVTESVKPWTVVAGNPAKVVSEIPHIANVEHDTPGDNYSLGN